MTSAIPPGQYTKKGLIGSVTSVVGAATGAVPVGADKPSFPEPLAQSARQSRPPLGVSEAAVNAEIIDVINTWSFARDQGRWDECAATFTTDGRIEVSWYQGPHAGFIAASRKGVGGGYSKHMMLGTTVRARGDRAFAETSVLLCMRTAVHGVDAIGTSQLRFLDRLKRTGPSWQIVHRVAVFDSDHIVPEHAAETIPFDKDKLAELPRPYRYLGYGLRAGGMKVPLDLPTLGSAVEGRVRADCLAWCQA